MTAKISNRIVNDPNRRAYWAAGLACVVALALWAARPMPVGAASGASFLKIPVGARAVGMGNAYTAVANDVTALHWNPAGLSGMTKKELGLMHAELFSDTRYDFIGYAHPLKFGQGEMSPGAKGKSGPPAWSLGVSGIYLSHGALEGRDDAGRKTGDFSASDFAFTIGLGHRVSKRTAIGGNLKVVRESLAGEEAKGVAADLGALVRTKQLALGLAVQNLGPSLKFAEENYNLPLVVSAGTGYRLGTGMMLSFDYRYRPIDHVSALGFGGELNLLTTFSIRAGYLNTLSSLQKTKQDRANFVDQISGLGLGFGVKIRRSRLDYAMTPMGELGVTQRFSLTLQF